MVFIFMAVMILLLIAITIITLPTSLDHLLYCECPAQSDSKNDTVDIVNNDVEMSCYDVEVIVTLTMRQLL